jgi:hypothetical protein
VLSVSEISILALSKAIAEKKIYHLEALFSVKFVTLWCVKIENKNVEASNRVVET